MNSHVKTSESVYETLVEDIHNHGKLLFLKGYRRIVFTNGCFDVLHMGHLKILDQCRLIAGLDGAVVVGINSDSSVKKLKGQDRPINDEYQRASMLVHLKPVDHVVVFEEDTPLELIEKLRPDVIVKGGDYEAKNVVGANISAVVIVPFEEGYSTTSFVERVRNGK